MLVGGLFFRFLVWSKVVNDAAASTRRLLLRKVLLQNKAKGSHDVQLL
jgi:hypothetical protein